MRVTRSLGRPTDYRPAYCRRVESLGRKGKSRAEIAYALNIARSTLYQWASQHTEFAEALEKAKAAEQHWWEEIGRANLTSRHFQGGLWCMSMAGRFDDYRRRPRRPHPEPNFAHLLESVTKR